MLQVSLGEDRQGRLIYPAHGYGHEPPPVPLPALKINGHVSAPLVFAGIFTPDECTRILDIGRNRQQRAGRMMYARPDVRKSTIAWIGLQTETGWLYDKVWQTLVAVNRWYEFDILGLVDELQLASYAEGDRFDWHLDTGGGQTSTRKISMSVQLSDEADYDGGEVEFCAAPGLEPRRRLGTVIVFPSFLAHRVTPVTRGTRRSLVAWAHGPTFK